MIGFLPFRGVRGDSPDSITPDKNLGSHRPPVEVHTLIPSRKLGPNLGLSVALLPEHQTSHRLCNGLWPSRDSEISFQGVLIVRVRPF